MLFLKEALFRSIQSNVVMSQAVRKIIHIDMDCFYAAVEERDHPEYQGKPLVVGGTANRRGVLFTCNYLPANMDCTLPWPPVGLLVYALN